MALTITNDTKFTYVDGVYKGQKKVLKFGLAAPESTFWRGPHFLAFTSSGSSLTLKALFDPTKSRLIDSSKANSFITYLQVGQFLLNGLPFPLRIYDANPEVPPGGLSYQKSKKLLLQQFSWTDMPAQKLDGTANVLPFYAAWPLGLINTFTFDATKKYPQEFGSCVVSDDKLRNNFYQAAYLSKTVSVGLEKFPSNYDPALYLQNIDVSGIRANGILPGTFTPQNMASQLEEIMVAFFSAATVPKPVDMGAKKILISPTRIYLNYKTQYRAQGRKLEFQTEELQVLFYATDAGTVAWSFLDEDDFENEVDDKRVNGPLDISKLVKNIQAEGENKFWLTNWNRESLAVAFEMTTIACQAELNSDGTLLTLKLLEGFQWQARRRFYPDKDADAIEFKVRDLDPFGGMVGLVKDTVTANVLAQSERHTTIKWLDSFAWPFS